ncbi:bifunctional DNA primase/polymerase [Labedaea rhizosphaerae]|nr:bifunctional DNA primase/polymerase [Labedaea rhizosphaerae]
MVDSEWSDSWRGAFRVELRAEAIGLAWRGWPVLPGTYPTGSVNPAQARWAGRDGVEADGLMPVHENWQQRIGTDAEQVAAWWTGQPYSLLLATGVVLDAIEVPDELGRQAARALRLLGVPVPIVATPDGKWLFLTTVAGELRADLANNADVTLHGAGSWIPLPPSSFRHGVAHWRVKPEVCGWEFPHADVVQNVLADALAGRVAAERQLVAVD